jgi:membrane fusion protein, multidrug efflux system
LKALIPGLLIGLAAGGLAMWLYQHPMHVASPASGETEHEAAKEPSFVQHTNGTTFLQIDQETQQRMGLKLAPLAAAQLKPELKAYGRVLDPSPLAALVMEAATANAALAASTREFERVTTLARSQNASARALETAEATLKRDQIAAASIEPRLWLAWGKAVASQPDLPAFVQRLAKQEAALVRVDVPLADAVSKPPTGGRLAALTSPDAFHDARLLGPAPGADPQLQGQGWLFLQEAAPLPQGAAVVAWLTVPGDPESGVIVPREALIRHEGTIFVYLQTGAAAFARKEIELIRPTDTGWFVREGVKAQDRVVTVGAQLLLSEELKGQGGEEE